MLRNFEQVHSFNTETSVPPLKIPPDTDNKDSSADPGRTPHLLISEGRVLHDFQQVVGSGIKTEGLIAPLKATTCLQD